MNPEIITKEAEIHLPWILQVISDYRFIIMPALCAIALTGVIYVMKDLFEGFWEEIKGGR